MLPGPGPARALREHQLTLQAAGAHGGDGAADGVHVVGLGEVRHVQAVLGEEAVKEVRVLVGQ